MRLLVCGGAGYIGSHICKLLAEVGHAVAVLDNFSTGHRKAVKFGELFEGDIGDKTFVDNVFQKFMPTGILHFAARSQVAESVSKPAIYYQSNVVASLHLLDKVREFGCPIVFSSTAAVFGRPRYVPIDELHPREPINSYGRSKAIIEDVLEDYATSYGLRSVSLRYFNAAGADPDGHLGEAHQPETHLIPLILESLRETTAPVKVFGDDYETLDGTCVRDYIHVDDICAAHLAALKFLDNAPGAHRFNLGNGAGFSVMQVLEAVKSVTGIKPRFELVGRRPGDPDILIANSSAAREHLGWIPKLTSLEQIIDTAWRWHQNRQY